jgi:RNA polymerase sigma-54 factor
VCARYTGGMFQQQAAKVHMTPQLRQAIRMLQLSTPDLLEVVRNELEENPVLESVESDSWDVAPILGSGTGRTPGADPVSAVAGDVLSLESHLREQLRFTANVPDSVRRIILYMIGNLDPNGYLEPSVDQIAGELQVEREKTETALRILQGFDPPGVGARDVKECLTLQANQLASCPPLVHTIIADHLDDVAFGRVHKMSKALQVAPKQIQSAIDVIKALNPRPGAAYEPVDIQYIIPDVLIEKAGDQFVVSIHDTAVPRLSVSKHYLRLVKDNGIKDEERAFLEAKRKSAVFFIQCLEQRRLTLLRVARAIVEEQIDFFRNGVSGLKPMILRQIAAKLNLHESTVSRATAGKYAQTPWGVFELAFFFPSGFNKGREDAASAESVKHKIREWVRKEDNRKPYSDQQLASIFQLEGIPISRRTVTKYREELGIQSSVKRRVQSP